MTSSAEAAVGKVIGAAEFKKHCLRILDEVQATGEPVTVTKRGKPVATLGPSGTPEPKPKKSLFGVMAGTVLHYERPFDPVLDDSEIDAWTGRELDR